MLKDIANTLSPSLQAIAEETVRQFTQRHPRWSENHTEEGLFWFATTSLEAIFHCMSEDRLEPLRTYLKELLLHKLERDVDMSEVVEGFTLGKTAMSVALQKEFPEAGQLLERLATLDAFYIAVVAMITDQYSALLLTRQGKEHERTQLLLEASRTITSSLSPDAVLEKLARILAETVDDGCCTIFMRNPENGSLTPQAGWGYNSELCMLSATGLRLCTQGNDLQTLDGKSYGLCSLNSESSNFADLLPEALSEGKTNFFPITTGDTMLGMAILSSRSEGFSFDEDTISLVEGILNGVAVAVDNATNTKRTERKLNESEGLRRVANRLLSRPDADQESVLTLICEEARKIVGGTGSAILLKEGDNLRYAYGAGKPQPPIQIFPIASTRYGEIFEAGEIVGISDAQAEIPAEQRSDEVRTLIVVPLVEGDEKVGLILVSNKKTGFDIDDYTIMEMFAAQAVLALRNARLAEQSEMITVAGERQRLARELHDSVTQALYAANLCAEAANRSLKAGKHEGASEQLDSLRGMTQQAMRDMRSLIFDLHPPELESEGLVGAIRSRLNSVEGRSGINPDLRVSGDERRLPILVEEELFRIAIEALNNAAKHSHASHVYVSLDYGLTNISLSISDNGTGYEIDALPSGGVGLRSMKERAKRISGELQIISKHGEGCTIRIDAPLEREGEA